MAQISPNSNAALDAFIAKNKAALVYFMRKQNDHCQEIQPYVNTKGRSMHMPTAFVNVDFAPDIVAKYKVDAVPFFIVLTKDGVKHKQAGHTKEVVDACVKIGIDWI